MAQQLPVTRKPLGSSKNKLKKENSPAWFILLAMLFLVASTYSAQNNYYTRQAGIWSSTTGVWSTVSHTGASCSCSPGTSLGGSNVVYLYNSVSAVNTLSGISGSAKITVQSGDTLTITTATLTIGGSGSITINTGGVFILNGGLTMSGGTNFVNNGKAIINGSVNNSGSATITNNSSFFIYGNLTTSGGAAVNGSGTTEVSGTVSGPGTSTVGVLPTTWGLNGNAGTTSKTNFLGTTDTAALSIRTAGMERIRVKNNGAVQFNAFSGTSSGLVLFDSTGSLKRKNLSGNSGDVLFGDGTFRPVTGTLGWSVVPVTGWNSTNPPPAAFLVSNPSYNVGIGTNYAEEKLTVAGNISAHGTVTATGLNIVFQSAGVAKQADTVMSYTANGIRMGGITLQPSTSTGPINAISGSAADLLINSSAGPWSPIPNFNTVLNAGTSSNVGIGTLTPIYKLDVAGNNHTSGMIYANGSLRSDSDLVVGGNATLAKSLILAKDLTVGGKLILASGLTLGSDLNVTGNITSTGVLTAGGLNLSNGLSVAGNIQSTGTISAHYLSLTNAFTVDTIYANKQVLVNKGLLIQGNSGPKNSSPNSIDAVTSDLLIQSQGIAPSVNTIINAKSNGNVGIGTFNPQAKLHVSGGDILADGALSVTGTTNLNGPVNFGQGISTAGDIAGGNISAGKSLSVNGNMNATGNLTTGGNVFVGGAVIADKAIFNYNLAANGNLSVANQTTLTSLSGTGYSMVVADPNGVLYPLSFAGPGSVGNPLPPAFNSCYPWTTCGNSFLPADMAILGTTTPNDLILQSNGIEGLRIEKAYGTMLCGGGGSQVNLGSAAGIGLNYGNGYVGFNATRDPNLGTWRALNHAANNAGSMIWANGAGQIYFSMLPNTGTSADQTNVPDATVVANTAFTILPVVGQTQVAVTSSTATNATLWTMNSVNQYGFGVDAAGFGHIYTNTSSPVSSMTFDNLGNVAIGTSNMTSNGITYALSVKGQMHTVEVLVEPVTSWPDYVFEKNHKMLSLGEVKQYIDLNGHLPEVPSASDVKKNGINLGEADALFLKKIEELTLYLIEMKKENEELKNRLSKLEKQH